MARVTVEDCVDKVPNRFDLVLLSGFRARQLSGGADGHRLRHRRGLNPRRRPRRGDVAPV